jgi:2',3'-cyclic-nucleotide 2'-phosphodiesterase (5'-nucleotidase family)
MKKILLYTNAVFILALHAACIGPHKLTVEGGDGAIQIAILQMNDVYEIAGVDNGKQGDLSRVAYYYNSVKEQYPECMLLISGDFVNPSLIGTLKYQGERIKGRQMIEVLNAIGLDLATFGNHEFDLDYKDLQARIDESEFDWVASNANLVSGNSIGPFMKTVNSGSTAIPEYYVKHFEDADGTKFDLGFFTALTPVNKVSYVEYTDPDSTALEVIKVLRDQSDLIIGFTHLGIEEDLALAEKVQNVPLFIGGHDHDQMLRTTNGVTIAKADANAKTVYLHIISARNRKKISIESRLITMDESVPTDPVVKAVIDKWKNILEDVVRQVIDQPYEVVYRASTPLDGRESTIRHKQTFMGELFTKAMLSVSAHNASCAMMNSGSIRIDDQIGGDILAIDIFRALPFGGSILDVTITGKLLLQILEFSAASAGSGAFLQYTGINKRPDGWYVDGKLINASAHYNVAINDFLLAGYDMPFLTRETDGIVSIDDPKGSAAGDLRKDIRVAIIEYLKGL